MSLPVLVLTGGQALAIAGIVLVTAVPVAGSRVLRRWRQRRRDDPSVPAELAELRARVLDLEERLEFAERLLAGVRQDALPPGTPSGSANAGR
jgi:hypothetical protein